MLNKEPEDVKEETKMKEQKPAVPVWNKLKSKVSEAVTFCDQMTNQVVSRTKNLDSDITDAQNLTDDIMDHLRVNMHYRAIVEPRNTRIYGIKEVKYRIAQNFRFLKGNK
ncbi:unnamed protein product [Onchocerca flexuosa]|uniref:Inner capsid protein VP2 n=1 Tax=Onchocerca flexuosa TaxID=387005 RepID=A0A183HL66_9BILA|nr:unnamed protein product [Onchocerca flexuosa]